MNYYNFVVYKKGDGGIVDILNIDTGEIYKFNNLIYHYDKVIWNIKYEMFTITNDFFTK